MILSILLGLLGDLLFGLDDGPVRPMFTTDATADDSSSAKQRQIRIGATFNEISSEYQFVPVDWSAWNKSLSVRPTAAPEMYVVEEILPKINLSRSLSTYEPRIFDPQALPRPVTKPTKLFNVHDSPSHLHQQDRPRHGALSREGHCKRCFRA